MGNGDTELRRIAWGEVFPFVRLFQTFRLAIVPSRMLLALLCVAGCYIGGRVLDSIWTASGCGVALDPATRQSEIDAYAVASAGDFDRWRQRTERARQKLERVALVKLGQAEDEGGAERLLATRPVKGLLDLDAQRRRADQATQFVQERLKRTLATLADDRDLPADERAARRATLAQCADYLLLTLAGHAVDRFDLPGDTVFAFNQLAPPGAVTDERERGDMLRIIESQAALNNLMQSNPRGPFITLLGFESRCFAAAIHGVCSFRWGFGGGALDSAPSLLGSIVSAGRGIAWFVTQRPWYAVFYALLHFVLFSFIGGAVCRHAAVQVTRDETLSLGAVLGFARQKFGGLLLAPVIPAAFFLFVAVALWLGGLVTAIPVVGELLAGVLYGLALLGGFALAMILLATVLGLHLMWPAVAVEGSDAFEAVTHAAGYVGQRTWHAGFYSLLLLLYGGVSFVMVRLIGMLLLKLTHVFSGAGMTWFGNISGWRTHSISKLDAMWSMPAWNDLTLLPATGTTPFWGTFFNAPLSFTETIGAFLIACWVFLVVAAVGAFVVSFFFCGSTQMFLLLRRDVDAVDYDEIFYEEAGTEPQEPAAASVTTDAATDAERPADEGGAAPADDSSGQP
jgi:hypothetical protein